MGGGGGMGGSDMGERKEKEVNDSYCDKFHPRI